MKTITSILLSVCCIFTVNAKRVYRSEFLPFDTREAAEQLDRTGISKYIPYNGEDTVDIPTDWFDSFIYLRLGSEEYDLTSYLRQGVNSFEKWAGREGYLFAQEKRSVWDYSVTLVPDSLGRDFGMLDLEIIVRNGYNYPEPITVGYDIYDPTGKLLDFSVNEVTVDGRSTDTLRFTPYIYHTYDHRWQPNITKKEVSAPRCAQYWPAFAF